MTLVFLSLTKRWPSTDFFSCMHCIHIVHNGREVIVMTWLTSLWNRKQIDGGWKWYWDQYTNTYKYISLWGIFYITAALFKYQLQSDFFWPCHLFLFGDFVISFLNGTIRSFFMKNTIENTKNYIIMCPLPGFLVLLLDDSIK